MGLVANTKVRLSLFRLALQRVTARDFADIRENMRLAYNLAIFAGIMALTGCAADPARQRAYELFQSGQYQAAANMASGGAANDTYLCFVQAVSYVNLNQSQRGIGLMKLCAERGGPEAQNYLAQNGIAYQRPQIRQESEYTAGDAAADFLTGFNKGMQQNKTTNCTSTRMPGGSIDTTCN